MNLLGEIEDMVFFPFWRNLRNSVITSSQTDILSSTQIHQPLQ